MFFIFRDPIKFPDFISHAKKRNPQNNMKSPTMMWDFWSLNPGSPLHQVTMLFLGSRYFRMGYRHMDGFRQPHLTA